MRILLLLTPLLMSAVSLDKMMSPDDQRKTGVSTLTPSQKQQLEMWIDKYFIASKPASQNAVYLAQNIDGGKKLRFSDGSLYEVSPLDVSRTAFWITPFQLQLGDSGDTEYPVKITNMTSGTSVKARMLEPASS